MSEVIKYSAIKLFGTTISLPPDKDFTAACHLQQQQSFSSSISCDYIKSDSEGELTGTKREDVATKPAAETLIEPATSAEITETRNTEEPSESDVSQEKTPKKPDKILPCPRCKSMDTKFCYFNNYNVNQPRHFCKLCKRYWTSGGTMRNVPVGSGRCKNRNVSASSYGHMIVPASLIPNGTGSIPVTCDPTMPNWGCTVPSGQNVPFLSRPPVSTLGKHSRDGNVLRTPNIKTPDVSERKIIAERYVLIPKTLRFDDLNVAAKSSIWPSLGIKNEKIDSAVGFFRTLPAKADGNSFLLQANPAALSRSFNFRESV